MIEPFGLFGLEKPFKSLGIFGYLLLVFITLIISITISTFGKYVVKRTKSNVESHVKKSEQEETSQMELKDKYTVLKVIRESECASVFKVSDLYGKILIIKKTKTEFHSPSVLNELIQISSPHLLSPEGFWLEDGFSYEKVPYIEGWRVSDILAQGDFGFQGAFLRKFIIELCEAIKALHDNRIIHRDIHPDNIIFSKNSKKFVLIDYSFAVKINTRTKITVGRIGYSDKYQLSGKANIGSDLYSLGATLYYSAYINELPAFEERESNPQRIEFPIVANWDNLPDGVRKLLSTGIENRFKSIEHFTKFIRSKFENTQKERSMGVLELPNGDFILMRWLRFEYIEKERFLNFLRNPRSFPDFIISEDLRNYFFIKYLKTHDKGDQI